MVVIVTGERDWSNKQQIWDELDVLLNEYTRSINNWTEAILREQGFVLRHGVGGKADFAANEWGRKHGVTIERFPAEWGLIGGGTDYSAGLRRNRAMAQKDPRADVCLAFWSGKFTKRGSREVSGTFQMITEALAAGITVNIHPPRTA